jgi:hypothetical protein
MRRFIFMGLLLLRTALVLAQNASISPGTGHWVVIDSGYVVGTSAEGKTIAPLHFYNTSTSEKITGLQFRVHYDVKAFQAVKPDLKISKTDQSLQYVDDNANGHLTVTVVYTGSSSSFSYSDGATFDLEFTHVKEDDWNVLDSIKTLKITGVGSFPNLASTVYGNDTTLVVHSYGGRFNQRVLRFAAKFMNTTGSNSKSLTASLEKRAKGSSIWQEVDIKKTNDSGVLVFREFLDTTYWDVRMAVVGDTMKVGEVYSTADAQKINQAVLGQYTPQGFDFYSFDVNGSDGNITIADVYGVYGRLAGRFTEWPNGNEDVLFFSAAEYNSIIGSSSNLTQTYPGVTNFVYDIDGKDSISFYVNVRGDANSTGFKMARLTPIQILNPDNAKYHIIDQTVTYDGVKESVEINMPKINVDEGNLVNVPVKVLTGGKTLSALQLDLKYDTSYLEFKKISSTEKIMKWMSYLNPSNGIISWGGADLLNTNHLMNGEEVFTLQFIAKRPQEEWATAAIWTGPKFVGDKNAKDLNVTPAMGIVQVRRIKKSNVSLNDLESILVFPNPAEKEIQIEFSVSTEGPVDLGVNDLVGRRVKQILKEYMPAGNYKYEADLSSLSNGLYLLKITTVSSSNTTKIILNR